MTRLCPLTTTLFRVTCLLDSCSYFQVLLLKQAAYPSDVGNDCYRDILDTQGVEQLLGQGHGNEDHRCIGPHRNEFKTVIFPL